MTKPSTLSLRSGAREKTLVSCSVKIRLVYDELWDADPLALGIPVRSVNLTKGCAKRGGWLPAEAWRDIDDPECEPVMKPTPRYIRLAEDYRELTQEQGYDRKGAAKRLGVTVDGLNAALGYYNKKIASAS